MRKISQQEALDAARTIDLARAKEQGYPNGFHESTKYDIEIKGNRYPPKAILGIALGLGPSDFSGGVKHAHTQLAQTGFPIFKKESTTQGIKKRGVLFWASRAQEPKKTINRKPTTKIRQRHVEMQQKLLQKFIQDYGKKHVAIEWPIQNGRVDVALLQGQNITLFEIKTAKSPLACTKEALGQLLRMFGSSARSSWRLSESLWTCLEVQGMIQKAP